MVHQFENSLFSEGKCSAVTSGQQLVCYAFPAAEHTQNGPVQYCTGRVDKYLQFSALPATGK